MLPSGADLDKDSALVPGRTIAVAAEVLYLVNLMILPGFAFLALAVLWKLFNHAHDPELARAHLRQTFWVSFWGGVFIVSVCTIVYLLLSIHSPWMWTIVILYFTCVHSTLILLGVVGLTKAMAGKTWRYPVIGPR